MPSAEFSSVSFPGFSMMKFDILTLFPDLVAAILKESILGRAQAAGLITVSCHNIRDYSENKHHNVDDTPYGGGNGMVMAAGPIERCFKAAVADVPESERRRVIYLSPKGKRFSQDEAKRLSEYDRLILLCGHYEGVDERVLGRIVDEEISIGDYVLTGGEIPACVVADAVSRLVPGVLAAPECHEEESIACGLLEYPQYTRPPVYEGEAVPEVLLSGDHERIRRWRLEESLRLTEERRPDLFASYMAAHPPAPAKKKSRKTPNKPDEPTGIGEENGQTIH